MRCAERRFLGRVVKVHSRTPVDGVPAPAGGGPRRRAARSTTARGAGTRARSTPRCCRSRRAPGWRSRTRCGRRGRSRPWRPRRLRSASSGGSASTAHAAYCDTLIEPSTQDPRLGEQVLHRLERADGDAVLLPLLRVLARGVEHAFHRADEIGDGDRERRAPDCGRSRPSSTASTVGVVARRRRTVTGASARVRSVAGAASAMLDRDDPAGGVAVGREQRGRGSVPAQSTATPSADPTAGTTREVERASGRAPSLVPPSSSSSAGAGGRDRRRPPGRGTACRRRRVPAPGPRSPRRRPTPAGRRRRRARGARTTPPTPPPWRGAPSGRRRRDRRPCGARGRRPARPSPTAARPARASTGCPCLRGPARRSGAHSAIAWPATKRDGSCALPWSKPPLRRMNVVVRRRMRQPSGVRTYSSVYQPRRILWVVCSMNT